MRESRSYGSARGVAGDRYPYRDPSFCLTADPIYPNPGPPANEGPSTQVLEPIGDWTGEAPETGFGGPTAGYRPERPRAPKPISFKPNRVSKKLGSFLHLALLRVPMDRMDPNPGPLRSKWGPRPLSAGPIVERHKRKPRKSALERDPWPSPSNPRRKPKPISYKPNRISNKLGSLCAGINRHDVKNERVWQERSSDPS